MDQKPLDQQAIDIFAWANNIQASLDVLDVELYLFNKKYTVYEANVSGELQHQFKQLFLLELVKYINAGPEKGMMVRGFEEAEAEDLIIQHTNLPNVENATFVLQQIEEPLDEVLLFDDSEHDFKRVKGMIARFSHKSLPRPFYAVKLVQQSQVLKGKTAWAVQGSLFKAFEPDAALKVPPEHQVLIIGDEIFVFNQRKFESMFGYNAKQQLLAKKKAEQIEKVFKLSFPEGASLQSFLKDKKSAVKKLQNLEIGELKQEELLDHAEEMGVELLTDEAGAIIIMDGKDLDKFVNLLNDDYVESNLTGRKYEIRSKKALE